MNSVRITIEMTLTINISDHWSSGIAEGVEDGSVVNVGLGIRETDGAELVEIGRGLGVLRTVIGVGVVAEGVGVGVLVKVP